MKSADRTVEDVLLVHAELAEMLRLTPKGLSNALWRGDLPIPCIKRGRRRLWRLVDVRAYLNTESREKAA